jgi:hypothetical protein
MSSTTTYIPSVRNVHLGYMDCHQLNDHVPRVYISTGRSGEMLRDTVQDVESIDYVILHVGCSGYVLCWIAEYGTSLVQRYGGSSLKLTCLYVHWRGW